MKKIVLAAVMLFAIKSITPAQNVGIGTNAPAASALLDVTASNKGILVPRMTNAQMLAIVAPANGLLIYNTDSAAFTYRAGTAWVFLKGNATASNDWNTKGNAGTDTSKNFIGTTDDVDLVFKRNNLRAGLINQSNSNTSWGANALNPASAGFFNTAIGGNALSLNNASGNTATGAFALESNVNGTENTAIGAFALESNVTGTENTAIGNTAMINNKAGSNNTANGSQALRYNDGLNNTAMGWASLYTNSTGNNNTAIGANSLPNNSLGSDNTAIGYNTGSGIINGIGNVLIGNNAGGAEQGSNKLYISNSATDNNSTLIYGEFDNKLLRSNGRMEINSDNILNDGLRVIKNYVVATNKNLVAVYGENAVDDNWGIGVMGKGGRVGVQGMSQGAGNSLTYAGVKGTADGINVSANLGVWGLASGPEFANRAVAGEATGSSGEKYGVYGSATGGGANYAVYGTASGGTTNYAGYFAGNVFTNGKLTISTTAGTAGLDLASSDAYAEMRVIRNTLGTADKDLYFGFGGPLNSSLHLFSDGIETMIVKSNQIGVGKIPLTSNNDSRFQVKQQGAQNGIGIEAANNTNHWDLWVGSSAASDLSLYYNGSSKGVFSNVNGAYVASSDRRLKKDIVPQTTVLNNLMQLQAYQYHYLDNKPADNLSNGFMAQDVQKIFPDAVFETDIKNGETRLGINYQYFTVLAIKGLQEQQQQMQSHEERIVKLEALVKTLAEKK